MLRVRIEPELLDSMNLMPRAADATISSFRVYIYLINTSGLRAKDNAHDCADQLHSKILEIRKKSDSFR
jgi:hypothetical protein